MSARVTTATPVAAKAAGAKARTRANTKPAVREMPLEEAVEEAVEEALQWLRKHASRATRDGMARYAIPSDHALGVSMGDIQRLGKQLGRHHALAEALWETGIYEARMLTAYVAEPERVTAAQMDRWCRDFDNWAICDTLCFALFDRTTHAWRKVEQWAGRRDEFTKRAAFALLATLALHDRNAGYEPFAQGLRLIEREAGDDRNFVKKGLSWALRSIGRRRDPKLQAEAMALAQRLAASEQAALRWLGKDALRDLAQRAIKRA